MLASSSGSAATEGAPALPTAWTSAAAVASRCSIPIVEVTVDLVIAEAIASGQVIAAVTVSVVAIAAVAIVPARVIGPVAGRPRAVIAVRERAVVPSRLVAHVRPGERGAAVGATMR
jgi:hypothetical protein